MRIIGIDPGSRITGFGIIDAHGNRYQYVHAGNINVATGAIPERIASIFSQLTQIIKQYQPSVASVEQVFMHLNADSALKLGQARGAAIAALVAQDIQIHEFSAKQIKNSITGTGQAQKQQVQFMVKRLLNHSQQLPEDAADALAAALCYGFSRGTSGLRH